MEDRFYNRDECFDISFLELLALQGEEVIELLWINILIVSLENGVE